MERTNGNLLTIRDVARRLNLSVSTVRRLVREGKFPPPLRIGNSHRWRPEVVEEFLKSQELATAWS